MFDGYALPRAATAADVRKTTGCVVWPHQPAHSVQQGGCTAASVLGLTAVAPPRTPPTCAGSQTGKTSQTITISDWWVGRVACVHPAASAAAAALGWLVGWHPSAQEHSATSCSAPVRGLHSCSPPPPGLLTPLCPITVLLLAAASWRKLPCRLATQPSARLLREQPPCSRSSRGGAAAAAAALA